jgi:hypothetical protein
MAFVAIPWLFWGNPRGGWCSLFVLRPPRKSAPNSYYYFWERHGAGQVLRQAHVLSFTEAFGQSITEAVIETINKL